MLGGNDISGTGYGVLQTVANWKSLQTLDMSNNALVGPVEDALGTFLYCDGSGGTGCGGNISSVAAPLLRVLKLDGNELTGERVYLRCAWRRMRQRRSAARSQNRGVMLGQRFADCFPLMRAHDAGTLDARC